MNLSTQDAAAALAQVEAARAAMRRAVRDHHGHFHLWLWGAAWVAMPLAAHFYGDSATHYFTWIVLPAGAGSALIGFTQGRQLKSPVNSRFVLALSALAAFALAFPFVLHAQPDVKAQYAYVCLVVMLAYVFAGVLFDNCLLWVGLALSALILVGLFCFPGVFWLWMAGFGGGGLILTGFYVRQFCR